MRKSVKSKVKEQHITLSMSGASLWLSDKASAKNNQGSRGRERHKSLTLRFSFSEIE